MAALSPLLAGLAGIQSVCSAQRNLLFYYGHKPYLQIVYNVSFAKHVAKMLLDSLHK